MTTLAARPGNWFERSGARWMHALWAAGWVAAAITAFISGASLAGAGLLAAAGLPGLVGWRAGRSAVWGDGARAMTVIAWVIPGLALVSEPGLAVLAFLAGPAALAASRQFIAALVSLTVNAAALIILAIAGTGPVAAGIASVPMALGIAGFVAACALLSLGSVLPRLARLETANAALAAPAEGFHHAPSALIVCDGEGRMQAVSAALRKMMPGLPREIAGLPVASLAYEDEGHDLLDQQLRHARGSIVTTMRGAGGRPVTLEAHAHKAGDGFVVVLSAPELESALVDRLRRERDEAIANSQAKSEFLAAISHELRTPLNAIIGFSDLMKQRLFGPMPARYAEYADLIHESGVHLLDLIGDVLDMSRIEADRYELVRETFDAGEVVETCVRMMRLRAEDRNIRLSCDAGTAALPVHADRKALRQIVLNLLSNAIKFTPHGGAVVVMLRASGPDLVIAVGDSGPGMSDAELNRLGQAYAQASTARQSEERGSGLGLALVQALAGLHGGALSLKSRQGEGTTATIRLPVMTSGKVEADEETPEIPAVHAQIRRAQEAGQAIAQQAAAS